MKKILPLTIGLLLLALTAGRSLFILAQEDANNKEEEIAQVNYTGSQYRDPLGLPIELRRPIEPVVEKVLREKKKEITKKAEKIVLPTFTIQGMIWGGTKPQALINDQLCEKGDIIKGAKITDITKEGVVFVYKDKKFIVRPMIKSRKIGER